MRTDPGDLKGARTVGERLHSRRGLVLRIAALLLVPVLCGGGILMYLAERSSQSQGAAVGVSD